MDPSTIDTSVSDPTPVDTSASEPTTPTEEPVTTDPVTTEPDASVVDDSATIICSITMGYDEFIQCQLDAAY